MFCSADDVVVLLIVWHLLNRLEVSYAVRGDITKAWSFILNYLQVISSQGNISNQLKAVIHSTLRCGTHRRIEHIERSSFF